ncbi:MAG: N-acetyltransferase [Alphaproteobacteria bacterium]|nr:N-acetyltransferase [Alphaproteobacteria bacterium]
MYQISTERPEDEAAIEQLLDKAFGANRQSKTSYRYREGVDPVADLKLVARDADQIVGTLRFWPVAIGLAQMPALLLGPLAVAPVRQGEGIGGALMRQGLDMALWARHRVVLLVGDRGYYARFGFEAAWPYGLTMPGERVERLMVRGLEAGALDGVVGAVQPWRAVREAA